MGGSKTNREKDDAGPLFGRQRAGKAATAARLKRCPEMEGEGGWENPWVRSAGAANFRNESRDTTTTG